MKKKFLTVISTLTVSAIISYGCGSSVPGTGGGNISPSSDAYFSFTDSGYSASLDYYVNQLKSSTDESSKRKALLGYYEMVMWESASSFIQISNLSSLLSSGISSGSNSLSGAEQVISKELDSEKPTADDYRISGMYNLLVKGNKDAAKEHISKAIELNPSDGKAWLFRWIMGEDRSVEDDSLKKAAELLPSTGIVKIMKALQYVKGDWSKVTSENSDKIITLLNEAENTSSAPLAKESLSHVYAYTNKLDSALSKMKEACSTGNTSACNNLDRISELKIKVLSAGSSSISVITECGSASNTFISKFVPECNPSSSSSPSTL